MTWSEDGLCLWSMMVYVFKTCGQRGMVCAGRTWDGRSSLHGRSDGLTPVHGMRYGMSVVAMRHAGQGFGGMMVFIFCLTGYDFFSFPGK